MRRWDGAEPEEQVLLPVEHDGSGSGVRNQMEISTNRRRLRGCPLRRSAVPQMADMQARRGAHRDNQRPEVTNNRVEAGSSRESSVRGTDLPAILHEATSATAGSAPDSAMTIRTSRSSSGISEGYRNEALPGGGF